MGSTTAEEVTATTTGRSGPAATAFMSIKEGPTAMKGGTASPTTSKWGKYSQLPTALLICRNFFIIAMLHKMHPTCTVSWYACDFAGIVCVVLLFFFCIFWDAFICLHRPTFTLSLMGAMIFNF